MAMAKCEVNNFPCIGVTYDEFDKFCGRELAIQISADLIVNHSSFCTAIPISSDFRLEGLKLNDYLTGLKGKTGIYHLWVDHEDCDDHAKNTMICLYVGKGMAEGRILQHIKEKFPDSDTLYVSFHECENRIAKYLEQLFLDLYCPQFNSAERRGTAELFAVWDDNRHDLGTELHEIANAHQKILVNN